MTSELDLVRHIAEDVEPPAEVLLAARSQLRVAIAAEAAEPLPRWRRPRLLRLSLDFRLAPMARLALAALVLVVAVVTLSGVLAPSPATARLADLAEAAEQAPLEELGTGQYQYTVSSGTQVFQVVSPGRSLSFAAEVTRQQWRAEDGSGVVRVTTGEPSSFAGEDALVLAPEEAAVLGVGATVEQVLRPGELSTRIRGLTADVDQLEVVLFREVAKGPRTRPAAVEVFDLAADLLRAGDLGPDVRGALFRVVGRLDGVRPELAQPGQRSFSMSFDVSDGVETLTVAFVEDGALLVAESIVRTADFPVPGTPRETVLTRVQYSLPVIVAEIG